MSLEWLLALMLASVLLFWTVGAYSRLVALRHAIAAAWEKVDAAARLRARAADALLRAWNEPLAAEHGALDALRAHLDESTRASAMMSSRPLLIANATAWVATESGVAAVASRVFALAEQQPDWIDAAGAPAALVTWRTSDERLVFARRLFNEAAAAHDAAIAQFPTRLLVPLFRFRRVGRL